MKLVLALLLLPLVAPPAAAYYSPDSDWVPCGCPVDWVVNPALRQVPDELTPTDVGRAVSPVVGRASTLVAVAWARAPDACAVDVAGPAGPAWRRVATALCDPDPVPWVCVPDTRICTASLLA